MRMIDDIVVLRIEETAVVDPKFSSALSRWLKDDLVHWPDSPDSSDEDLELRRRLKPAQAHQHHAISVSPPRLS